MDCKVLKCSAPGAFANISAAFFKFSDDCNSHSDVMIFALFSLSASACFHIVLFKLSGRFISLSSTDNTSTHRLSDFSSTISLIFLLASSLFANNSSSSNCHTIFLIVVSAN
jgi:hypothetical protein